MFIQYWLHLELPFKFHDNFKKGDLFRIETPGSAGYGTADVREGTWPVCLVLHCGLCTDYDIVFLKHAVAVKIKNSAKIDIICKRSVESEGEEV